MELNSDLLFSTRHEGVPSISFTNNEYTQSYIQEARESLHLTRKDLIHLGAPTVDRQKAIESGQVNELTYDDLLHYSYVFSDVFVHNLAVLSTFSAPKKIHASVAYDHETREFILGYQGERAYRSTHVHFHSDKHHRKAEKFITNIPYQILSTEPLSSSTHSTTEKAPLAIPSGNFVNPLKEKPQFREVLDILAHEANRLDNDKNPSFRYNEYSIAQSAEVLFLLLNTYSVEKTLEIIHDRNIENVLWQLAQKNIRLPFSRLTYSADIQYIGDYLSQLVQFIYEGEALNNFYGKNARFVDGKLKIFTENHSDEIPRIIVSSDAKNIYQLEEKPPAEIIFNENYLTTIHNKHYEPYPIVEKIDDWLRTVRTTQHTIKLGTFYFNALQQSGSFANIHDEWCVYKERIVLTSSPTQVPDTSMFQQKNIDDLLQSLAFQRKKAKNYKEMTFFLGFRNNYPLVAPIFNDEKSLSLHIHINHAEKRKKIADTVIHDLILQLPDTVGIFFIDVQDYLHLTRHYSNIYFLDSTQPYFERITSPSTPAPATETMILEQISQLGENYDKMIIVGQADSLQYSSHNLYKILSSHFSLIIMNESYTPSDYTIECRRYQTAIQVKHPNFSEPIQVNY